MASSDTPHPLPPPHTPLPRSVPYPHRSRRKKSRTIVGEGGPALHGGFGGLDAAVLWTREALEALGPVTDVPTTASVLDVAAWTVYAAIRRGDWKITRVFRLGRRIRIPTADLVAAVYERKE